MTKRSTISGKKTQTRKENWKLFAKWRKPLYRHSRRIYLYKLLKAVIPLFFFYNCIYLFSFFPSPFLCIFRTNSWRARSCWIRRDGNIDQKLMVYTLQIGFKLSLHIFQLELAVGKSWSSLEKKLLDAKIDDLWNANIRKKKNRKMDWWNHGSPRQLHRRRMTHQGLCRVYPLNVIRWRTKEEKKRQE